MFVQQVGEPDVGFDHVLIQLIKVTMKFDRHSSVCLHVCGAVPVCLWSQIENRM